MTLKMNSVFGQTKGAGSADMIGREIRDEKIANRTN